MPLPRVARLFPDRPRVSAGLAGYDTCTMPFVFLTLHGVAVLLVLGAMRRLPPRRWPETLAGLVAVGIVLCGFALERRPDPVLRWVPGFGGLVFCTNLTIEAVAALTVLLLRAATTRGDRLRIESLGLVLIGLSLASYGWYYFPVPPRLHGRLDESGLCLQTSHDSCTAAAAATLLQTVGIETTEAEMARLCLTRRHLGTSRLGLWHGLSVRAREAGLRPGLRRPGSAAELCRLGQPAVLTIGLRRGAPRAVATRLTAYGWSTGLRHTVVVLAADPEGHWLDVADPTYGRELWPLDDLEWLWDGTAIVLEPR